MNAQTQTKMSVSNIDKIIATDYKTMTAQDIADKLNAAGFKTPRGNSVTATWVAQRAQAKKVFKGARGERRTKRAVASRKVNAQEFRTSNSSTAVAEFAGYLATSKLPQAMKQKMFSALI